MPYIWSFGKAHHTQYLFLLQGLGLFSPLFLLDGYSAPVFVEEGHTIDRVKSWPQLRDPHRGWHVCPCTGSHCPIPAVSAGTCWRPHSGSSAVPCRGLCLSPSAPSFPCICCPCGGNPICLVEHGVHLILLPPGKTLSCHALSTHLSR